MSAVCAGIVVCGFLTTSCSATATSHTFGKVLERQPHRLARYFCHTLHLCIFARRRDVVQLHLTLQNHLDVLSNAIESPAFLATTLMEACQRLQLRVDAIVSTYPDFRKLLLVVAHYVISSAKTVHYHYSRLFHHSSFRE